MVAEVSGSKKHEYGGASVGRKRTRHCGSAGEQVSEGLLEMLGEGGHLGDRDYGNGEAQTGQVEVESLVKWWPVPGIR